MKSQSLFRGWQALETFVSASAVRSAKEEHSRLTTQLEGLRAEVKAEHDRLQRSAQQMQLAKTFQWIAAQKRSVDHNFIFKGWQLWRRLCLVYQSRDNKLLLWMAKREGTNVDEVFREWHRITQEGNVLKNFTM
jgi:hypothetical protein